MSHRVVATAGHVDHGKSTLLRALTGMEPDRLEDERRRGLSIDLGFVWTTLSDGSTDVTVSFVDVPGHERFVTTMLAGTGPVPAALFVVAADDGWSRQSQEHLEVLDLLGVPAVAVAITKADVTDDERVEAVRTDVSARLATTSLAGAPVLAVDGISGRGLDELRTAVVAGLARVPRPRDHARPRLWIDRTFTIPGAGTVVTGTLVGGPLTTGQQVRVLPHGARVRIRGLESLGVGVSEARPGERVAINLSGVDHHALTRGDVLVGDDVTWTVTDTVDVWVTALREVDEAGAWQVHIGSAHHEARLVPLAGPLGGDGPQQGPVRLRLATALPLAVGDRLILRDTGRRVVAAGAVVLDTRPRRSRLPRDQRIALLAELSTSRDAATLLRLWGGSAPVDDLVGAMGATDATFAGVEVVGAHAVDQSVTERWDDAVADVGPGTHDRAAIARALASTGVPTSVARDAVDHLTARGRLVRTTGGWSLAEHADRAEIARQRRLRALVDDLAHDGLSPRDLSGLAAHHGVDHRGVTELVQAGQVIRCGDVAFARAAVDDARAVLERIGAGGTPFTAAEARTAWETTRKFAIPLLEHLERTGVTRFDGDRHTLAG
ncbi:MAG: selenocysteine-specific translation elongation factor [Nitriliruptoraceae bacterium]